MRTPYNECAMFSFFFSIVHYFHSLFWLSCRSRMRLPIYPLEMPAVRHHWKPDGQFRRGSGNHPACDWRHSATPFATLINSTENSDKNTPNSSELRGLSLIHFGNGPQSFLFRNFCIKKRKINHPFPG